MSEWDASKRTSRQHAGTARSGLPRGQHEAWLARHVPLGVQQGGTACSALRGVGSLSRVFRSAAVSRVKRIRASSFVVAMPERAANSPQPDAAGLADNLHAAVVARQGRKLRSAAHSHTARSDLMSIVSLRRCRGCSPSSASGRAVGLGSPRLICCSMPLTMKTRAPERCCTAWSDHAAGQP